MDVSKLDTPAELEELIVAFEQAAAAYRERLISGEGRAELCRANVRIINLQRQHPYNVDTLEPEARGEAPPKNTYTVEHGIFVVLMIKEVADMKIINPGIGI